LTPWAVVHGLRSPALHMASSNFSAGDRLHTSTQGPVTGYITPHTSLAHLSHTPHTRSVCDTSHLGLHKNNRGT
jgi:hypothetical protein